MKFKKLPIFCITLACISVSTAIANTQMNKTETLEIRTQILREGKLLASPSILVRSGQAAKITNHHEDESLSMKLIATNVPGKQTKQEDIRLAYDIKYVHGNDVMWYRPKLIVHPQQTATIKFLYADRPYELRVLAKRKD